MSGLVDQLRQAIEESGLSRYAISKATGIDQGQLSNMMRGKVGLGLENIERLLAFLDLEIRLEPRKQPKGRG